MRFLFLFLYSLFAIAGEEFPKQQSFGFLTYHFFYPNKNDQKIPLLLLIHGCKEDSKSISEITGLLKLAQENQFALLVPEQNPMLNYDRCWNWFLPQNQMREQYLSETQTIIEMVREVQKGFPIDSNRIFVVGLSSGGAMSLNLAACYPDIFSGAAVHSGISYQLASDVFSADYLITHPPLLQNIEKGALGEKFFSCGGGAVSRNLNRFILFHGKEDRRVFPEHTQIIFKQLKEYIEMLNQKNLSPNIKKIKLKPPMYSYEVVSIESNHYLLKEYLIEQLGHAWSGGTPSLKQSDPLGPNASEILLNEFNLKSSRK